MPDVIARAPGRINLIGEHTDYQEGFVLPVAIPLQTTVSVRPRDDRRVIATSENEAGVVEYELGRERRGLGWGDYVQGVTYALANAGCALQGFEVAVTSDVPPGSGLSSSAALEVSLLRGLRDLFSLALDDVEIARLAQRGEVDLVGARVGIMDQMASSVGRLTAALFLDTRTLAHEHITLPTGLGLIAIDSGVTHRHAGGEYLQRRAEAEEAARLLGVATLRDVPPDSSSLIASLPPTLAKRARHIVTENARVLQAVEALRANHLARLGHLFTESHASMRDDYEVSTAEVDLLVDVALQQPGVFGARMTGGGFGGAAIALVRDDDAGGKAEGIAVRSPGAGNPPPPLPRGAAAGGPRRER